MVAIGARVGRPPKPTVLKVLHGDRRDRINDNEPNPAAVEVIRPRWLPRSARRVWDRLAPDLVAKGVLTAWDVEPFAELCCAISTAAKAWADVDEHGTAVVTVDRELADGTIVYRTVRNPNWIVARQATVLVGALGGRFGITPADRSRLITGGGRRGSSDDLLSD